MSEYDINWQAESAQEELELLKTKIKEFGEYINSPVLYSFHIINQTVAVKFNELFNE